MKTPALRRETACGGPRGHPRLSPNEEEGNPIEQYYVGPDVHSRQSAFVIEDDEGRVIAQGDHPKCRGVNGSLRQ